MAKIFSSKWGGKDKGTKDISSSGATFMEYGPSGEGVMKDNIYNDKDSGDIFARDGTYLGSINMEEGLNNPKLKALHTKYKKDPDNEFNSHNDIAGAIQKAYAAGDWNPGAEEKVVHSKEIQTAKERVKNWEDSVQSGEQSAEIFGGDPVNDTGSAADQTTKAANAFIDRKKRDVGKMLNEDIKV